MMTKKFSTREKVLLVILAVALVAALYFWLVLKPSIETMSTAQTEIDEIEESLASEEAKAEDIADMQAALEEMSGNVEMKSTITPLYNNFQYLLTELNSVLSSVDGLILNSSDLVFEDGLVNREIQLVFYTNNYASARDIIYKLYSGSYSCDITALKLSLAQADATDLTTSQVMVTTTIMYYEINK